MNKNEVRAAIARGEDPRRLGQLAHRILDYMELKPAEWWVSTPRYGWHRATRRELPIILDIENHGIGRRHERTVKLCVHIH